MATPAIPQSFYLQTGNGQVYLSWAITTGVTSYAIQRSTDGITYTALGTATAPNYLDTAVTLGTQYWYKVASVGSGGTSSYTAAQSAVPCPAGEMSLGELRVQAQQRADRLNSNFVTLPEWNTNINQSMFELYDLLVTAYEDYFVYGPVYFTTNGTQTAYPLPSGSNTFTDASGNTVTPPGFYKVLGVDLGLGTSLQNASVTVNKFNFIDRNKYVYPNSGGTRYGIANLRYRLMGSNIMFTPAPSASQNIGLWFIPRLTQLLADNAITTTGISGWLEYVIVDAAIKALQKEESDVSVLMMQKQALIKRIEEAAGNRDAGQPATIADIASQTDGQHGGGFGPNGGWM